MRRKRSQGLSDNATGGASGADGYGFIGPFGVSISGGGGFGDRDNARGQTGFALDTRQANAIVDYRLTDSLTGGFSFGYLRAQRTLGLNSGTLDSDAYRFSPFLSFTPAPNIYVTALAGYSRLDFNSNRTFTPFAGFQVSDARAQFGADQFFASLGAGYTHSIGAWSLRGYGRADYNHTSVERHTEQGAVITDSGSNGGSLPLTVGSQSILSTTSTLGAELSYALRRLHSLPW